MKIIKLQAENVKRLIAVQITPKGNLVKITGKNGNGKTSVLDAIFWGLAGSANIEEAPIRTGQKSARTRIDLGDIVVTRTIRAGKEGGFTTELKVENADGAKFPSPQAMLDKMLGALTFDPLAFSRMNKREQFDTLRRFVPGVDFDAIDADNKADFSKRTDITRRAKDARAASGGIAADVSPQQKIDVAGLVDTLAEAGRHNADIETRKGKREAAKTTIARNLEDADKAKASAKIRRDEILQAAKVQADAVEKEARDRYDVLTREAAELQHKLDTATPLAAPIDAESLRQQIEGATNANQAADVFNRKLELAVQAEALEKQAEDLTTKMEGREEGKRAAIAAAKLPVNGLGFGDGEVLLAGVPFAQGSGAERLRASIAIAMALNPKLRVIRVKDGGLLDEDSMALLEQMADKEDFQVWVESCHDDSKTAIVMEDGRVKGQVIEADAEKEAATA